MNKRYPHVKNIEDIKSLLDTRSVKLKTVSIYNTKDGVDEQFQLARKKFPEENPIIFVALKLPPDKVIVEKFVVDKNGSLV